MSDVVPPRERTCERCGREEEWDDDQHTWIATGEAGDAFCLHEWDINGTYNPLVE